jgi:hypothetical protein
MSIEEQVEQCMLALRNIQWVLEELYKQQGGLIIRGEDLREPSDEPPKTVVGSTANGADGKVVSLNADIKEVRAALKKLHKKKGQRFVKSLLKQYNASTIRQLDRKHYTRVIEDALTQIGAENE